MTHLAWSHRYVGPHSMQPNHIIDVTHDHLQGPVVTVEVEATDSDDHGTWKVAVDDLRLDPPTVADLIRHTVIADDATRVQVGADVFADELDVSVLGLDPDVYRPCESVWVRVTHLTHPTKPGKTLVSARFHLRPTLSWEAQIVDVIDWLATETPVPA